MFSSELFRVQIEDRKADVARRLRRMEHLYAAQQARQAIRVRPTRTRSRFSQWLLRALMAVGSSQ